MTRALVVVIALALAIVVFGSLAYRRLFDDTAATVGPEPVDPALVVGDNPLLSTQPSPTAAPAQGMVVRAVRGAVQVKSGDSGAWRDADAGTALAADDVVRAGRGAEATISLGDGVEVKLSPRSELRMREINEALARVRLDDGHVTATVDGGRGRVLRIAAKGSDAEAESKGGRFGVVTDGQGQLAVATTTGSVKLTAKGKSVDVEAGQASTVEPNAAPSQPTAMPSSLFLKIGALAATQTNQTTTTVTGTTSPGAVVRIGDQTAAADAKGKFALKVPLRDGKNELAVEVVDASGRQRDERLPDVLVDREKPRIDADVKWGTP
jgi:hypothetical protein